MFFVNSCTNIEVLVSLVSNRTIVPLPVKMTKYLDSLVVVDGEEAVLRVEGDVVRSSNITTSLNNNVQLKFNFLCKKYEPIIINATARCENLKLQKGKLNYLFFIDN